MALIEVRNLVKSYGRVRALREVTFALQRGVHGLIGPNGAGKTTILKVLLGLTRADGGESKVFGLDSQSDSYKILERVGVLHEKPCLPKWTTGHEYLRYVANLKGVATPEGDVRRVAETAGIAYALDKKIETYSAGMVQRIGLAAALIGEPELIILDEPTANLDPLGRIDILNTIWDLWEEHGVSFLISTHVLFELEKVCHDVVILHQGSVLDRGSISELRDKYFVKKYKVNVVDRSLFIDHFRKCKGVKDITVEDDEVVVTVEDQEIFFRELSGFINKGGCRLRNIKSVEFTLENIFVEAFRMRAKDEKIY